jgi:hypothetical protein
MGILIAVSQGNVRAPSYSKHSKSLSIYPSISFHTYLRPHLHSVLVRGGAFKEASLSNSYTCAFPTHLTQIYPWMGDCLTKRQRIEKIYILF